MGWLVNGIEGRGDTPPPCAGNFSGPAVVLGTGRSVWDDLHYKFALEERMGVIAVNNMILHFKGRVHHGVSLHPEEPILWSQLRRFYQCEASHVVTHSYRIPEAFKACDYIWDIEGAYAGTSSLLAVMVGLALGYNKIVLAGVPLDGAGHFYDPPQTETRQFTSSSVQSEWIKAAQLWLAGRVRSCSGWTQELLGGPDARWLNA